MSRHSIRSIAVQITHTVVFKKVNLSEVFAARLGNNFKPEFKSAVKALCYETIRHYLQLEDCWLQFVDKKPKDKMVQVILTQALAENRYMQKPAHVVVNEAQNTAKKLNKKWSVALINTCLRKAVEAKDHKNSSESAHYAHPQWWIDQLKMDWPEHWQELLIANNTKAPLWIRSRSNYKTSSSDKAHSSIKNAYKIEAKDIRQDQDFIDGKISVQDASAQLAAHILQPNDKDYILDACAAPGGKTCHLLELAPNCQLDAIEQYANRAKKIDENLLRLKLKANVLLADTRQAETWFKGKKYSKILLDVPCSASGIVRRHPDIKMVRQAKELKQICKDQLDLLNSVAALLEPGGKLLYSTCSAFRQENSDQIRLFLNSHPQFSEIKLKYPFAINCEHGIQIISGREDMDGFYYCYLVKNEL